MSFSPEAQRIIEAQREDLNRVRGDLVKGFEDLRLELHGGHERNAAHTLAVYRIVEQKLQDQGSEARAHRAEFVSFAAETRAFQQRSLALLLALQGRGQTEKRALHRAVSWLSNTLGTNPEVTRLVLVALAAALFASTLTACTLQVIR